MFRHPVLCCPASTCAASTGALALLSFLARRYAMGLGAKVQEGRSGIGI